MIKSLITSTPSIIEEVAKKLGIKKEKVKAVFDSNISYINSLALDDSTLSIRLPNIGTLYMQRNAVLAIQKRMGYLKERGKYSLLAKTEATYKSQFDKLKILEKYKEDNNKGKSPMKHFKRSMIKMKYHNGGKTIEEIEEIQNTIAEKNENI